MEKSILDSLESASQYDAFSLTEVLYISILIILYVHAMYKVNFGILFERGTTYRTALYIYTKSAETIPDILQGEGEGKRWVGVGGGGG
jgi:hypothetical protein